MKRNQLYRLCFLLAIIGFVSCQKERLPGASGGMLRVEEGVPGTLSLYINATPAQAHVITRSTTAATAEEKSISTLYVFVIRVNDESQPALNPVLAKRWFPDASALQDADGKYKVTLTAVSCGHVRIFAAANIHAPNQLSNNDELLEYYNNVTNEEQLFAAAAQLSSDSRGLLLTDRSQGNLPASGYFQSIYQNTGTASAPEYPLQVVKERYVLAEQGGRLYLQQAAAGNYNGHKWKAGESVNGAIWLQRLDAKINFEIKPAASLPQGAYFKLKSWQVINLHNQAYITTHPGQNVCANPGNLDPACVVNSEEMNGNYITETQITENSDRVKSQFTFYALENNHAAVTPFGTAAHVVSAMTAEHYSLADFTKADEAYVLREKKGADGSFKYAPAKAAYVILKGEFYTPRTEAIGSEGMQRAAKVKYLIHLGYVGDGNIDGPAAGSPELNKLNDYSILRNSVYTYKITVLDVENIRVEAEKNGGENQPSAEGSVIDSEFDLQADSHYEQRLIMFDIRVLAQKIDQASAKFAYTVKTPFTAGEETVEVLDSGDDDRPRNLDDQWIQFAYVGEGMNGKMNAVMAERMQEGGGYGLPYAYTYTTHPDESQVVSDPVQLWNPTALLRNLNIWKKRYDKLAGRAVEGVDTGNPYIVQDDGSFFYLQRFFTVYVDEYYYTQNPTTGTASNMLWTQFCNTGDRTMRVFLTNSVSADNNSSYSRSGLNIRQKSIQTPYALSATEQQLATVAFGMEHTDEYGRNYYVSSTHNYPFVTTSTEANGLENTLLGLYQNSGLTEQAIGPGYYWKELYKIFPQSARTSEGQTPAPGTDHTRRKRLVNVAALSRNRDNNRNGIIDRDELKWYIPAQKQMQNLYLASFFAEDPLFEEKLSADRKVCYVTSTSTDAAGLRFQVASRGPVLGAFRTIDAVTLSNSYIRCARNLGTPPTLNARPPYTDGTSVPQEMAQIRQLSGSGNYIITYNKYSDQGIRYYIAKGPLGSHNQNQSPARVYQNFIIAKNNIYGQKTDGSFNTVSPGAGVNWDAAQKLCAGYSEETDCSDKGSWRLPNVSEALGMLMYMPTAAVGPTGNQVAWTCTRCSGTEAAPQYFSIDFRARQILTTLHTTPAYLRCIRDYRE